MNLPYLSPSAAGSRRLSRQSDIFSFGTLAYELVTTYRFDGKGDVEILRDVDILVDIHKHLVSEVMSPLESLRRQADFGTNPADLPPEALSDIIMKCVKRDPDERYGTLEALAYDLKRLGQICKSEGNLDKFIVGEADRYSRFRLPDKPVNRDDEMHALQQAWKSTNSVSTETPKYGDSAVSVKLINVWGMSGSGKTRMVQTWAAQLEKNRKGCLVAECKLDEFSQRPISSFLQIFQNLLDKTLADPEEDAKVWGKKIRDALGQQFSVFHAILPNDYRRLLLMGAKAPAVEAIDWANFLPVSTSSA